MRDMAQRDELARVIVDAYGEDTEVECPCEQDLEVAAAILAAGYSKPRTITTVEELDAMAEGTEIVDRYERLTLEVDVNGYLEWHDGYRNVCNVTLPATVLSTP